MSRYITSSEFSQKVASLFSPNSPRKKTKLLLDENYGDFHLNHFSTGLGISYTSFVGTLNEDTTIEAISKENISFLSFNTSASLDLHDLNMNKNIVLSKNTFWSGTEYEGHKVSAHYKKNNFYQIHHILFDPTFFTDLLVAQQNNQSSKNFFNANHVEANVNNKISKYQKNLLHEISSLDLVEDKLKEIYLESKILELIHNSFTSIHATPKDNEIYLSKKDIECLTKAKQLLISNASNPPSLKELAYKSAINEFKLKKGFKQLFGNTAYGVLQEYRLNEAKVLLESNDINISEACALVGYKSISHFSKIFKEYFGITPIEIKKQSQKIYY